MLILKYRKQPLKPHNNMEAIKKNQVRVDTSKYRFSHGRERKGRGRWAFSYKRDADFASKSGEILWFTGTYAEARKQAIATAAANGQSIIFVNNNL